MVIKIDIHQECLPVFEKTIACIGYFDGIHLGHHQLIQKTLEESNVKHLKAALISFEPDPLQIITGSTPRHILNNTQRIRKIQEYGIEDIVVFHFDEDLMRLDAIDFISDYLNHMNLDVLICGYDFSFGSMGKGDPVLLEKYGNFKTIVIPEYAYEGEKVSSTRIKEALFKGNFRLAEALLGYEYYADANVIKCTQNGPVWLVEAVLSDPDVIIPETGTYQGLQVKEDRLFIQTKMPYCAGEQIRIRYKDYERTV